MTLEEYLNLTDDEVEFLVAYEYGEPINDAFYSSAIKSKGQLMEENEEVDPAQFQELDKVKPLEKYNDQDVPRDSE